jgi:AcrR family transcriptional regulator
MEKLLSHIKISVNENLYLKDPDTSELGKKILVQAIGLIEESGLEEFTFKKLAVSLKTTESSVYRYFENKNKLLLYLSSWYWLWIEMVIVFSSTNIIDPEERLKKMIEILSRKQWNTIFPNHQMDLNALRNIVIAESSKAYLTKEVDADNKAGHYEGFKRLCGRFEMVLREINPQYLYPNMLASTIVEGVFHQQFLAAHIPVLSNSDAGESFVQDFFTQLSQKTLN